MAFLRMNLKSEAIGQCLEVEVFLPAYTRWNKEAAQPYKTLYFLPGYAASAKESLTFMNMQRHAMNHGLALVSFSGDRSFYMDQPKVQEMYGQFVGCELLELTRKLLPLSDRREDTYIGGISMGGYGAFRNGIQYHEKFSKIFALSPGIWYPGNDIGEVVPVIKEKITNLTGDFNRIVTGEDAPVSCLDQVIKKHAKLPELFLRCGKQDELVYSGMVGFVKDLCERGISFDYEEADGLHDLVFWSKMMEPAFDFLTADRLKRGEE